ncbi:glycosyltransferase family 4 protein [Methylobacillus sp.]|uniref:glycosyltransferase family 4 protein n=1 Tax=Methylobacillus sp. TaxID=56818 RepID=UPI0012C694B1|nr:glycosyltransferase family 4 protein [Methylobacillus sp.]MPS49407.1 glycosyltransferase family 4 protein [Methylobacillus sp.]
MKIAQIAPLFEAVPPRLYGGTERVVASICDALVKAGHQVDLYASGDSQSKARLIPCRERALRLDPAPLKSDIAAHYTLLDEVRRHAGEYDILHFHTDMLHFPFFEPIASKTLTTLHGRLDMADLPNAFKRWRQFPLVSISNDQRSALPGANWAGTVYHGLDPALYRFNPNPQGGYLAFLGRISPEKRPDRAIAIARKAGIPLKIAAKVDAADLNYYNDVIKPLLNQADVEFIGEITDAQKNDFLGNALALLFPVDWPEPFGLVMIEAMACGTPVIAWRCGSVPEIIEPGRNGFIVTDEHQAAAACHAATTLDRAKVREAFDMRFTSDVMAEHYLKLYKRLAASANDDNLMESQVG